MRKNYRFTISYDGSRYSGWQKQKKTDQTIQGRLEHTLAEMLRHEHSGDDVQKPGTDRDSNWEVQVIGAGRTDAGVHALAMTANAFLDTEMSVSEIKRIMNLYLPGDISVDDVRIASDRFHARFNAIGKLYRYTCYCGDAKPVFDRRYVTVLEREPDLEAMQKAADFLIGTHDYKAFCGNPHMKKPTIRTVDHIRISRDGSYLYLEFHGNGFLQNMVRILTGTLLEVGFGRMKPEEITEILEARDRTKAGPTAPAKGLCLVCVDYD